MNLGLLKPYKLNLKKIVDQLKRAKFLEIMEKQWVRKSCMLYQCGMMNN